MHVLVEITLIGQSRAHALITPHRPRVLIDQHLRVDAELVERGIEMSGPAVRVAHLRASKWQEIVECVTRKLCHIEDT